MPLAEAKVEKEAERRGRRKLHHLEIHPAHNGGHIIEHHFHPGPRGEFHEPLRHTFGPEQGSEAADHVAKHAKFHPPKERSEMREEIEEPEEE